MSTDDDLKMPATCQWGDGKGGRCSDRPTNKMQNGALEGANRQERRAARAQGIPNIIWLCDEHFCELIMRSGASAAEKAAVVARVRAKQN